MLQKRKWIDEDFKRMYRNTRIFLFNASQAEERKYYSYKFFLTTFGQSLTLTSYFLFATLKMIVSLSCGRF